MWPEERRFLYEAVRERNPVVALEVGTWKGGGSTLHITSALYEHGTWSARLLHTCEVDLNLFNEAVAAFENTHLRPYVNFNNKPSTVLINELIQSGQASQLGFVFFDGPEDPELNINDFKLLDPHLPVGTYFCMHDWDLGTRADGLSSTKATLIRPYLENLPTWQILSTLTAPASVGIVLAKKIA